MLTQAFANRSMNDVPRPPRSRKDVPRPPPVTPAAVDEVLKPGYPDDVAPALD